MSAIISNEELKNASDSANQQKLESVDVVILREGQKLEFTASPGNKLGCKCEEDLVDYIYKDSPEDILKKARSFKNSGMDIFQFDMILSTTRGYATGFGYVSGSHTTGVSDASGIINDVEKIGWHLEHVNYVYQVTEAKITDKLISAGGEASINGNIVGIYLFRAV